MKEKTYLRKTVLPALAFVISHLYDFTDLLNEGLPLTLQDELTLNLKHGAKLSTVLHVHGFYNVLI